MLSNTPLNYLMSFRFSVRDKRVDITSLQVDRLRVRKIVVRRGCIREKVLICWDLVGVLSERLGLNAFTVIAASRITFEEGIISIRTPFNYRHEAVLGISEAG